MGGEKKGKEISILIKPQTSYIPNQSKYQNRKIPSTTVHIARPNFKLTCNKERDEQYNMRLTLTAIRLTIHSPAHIAELIPLVWGAKVTKAKAQLRTATDRVIVTKNPNTQPNPTLTQASNRDHIPQGKSRGDQTRRSEASKERRKQNKRPSKPETRGESKFQPFRQNQHQKRDSSQNFKI